MYSMSMRAFRTHRLEGAPRARPKYFNPLADSPHTISPRFPPPELSALKSTNTPIYRIFFNPRNHLPLHRPSLSYFTHHQPSRNYRDNSPRSSSTTYQLPHLTCAVASISPLQAPHPVRMIRDLASSLRSRQIYAPGRVATRSPLQQRVLANRNNHLHDAGRRIPNPSTSCNNLVSLKHANHLPISKEGTRMVKSYRASSIRTGWLGPQ